MQPTLYNGGGNQLIVPHDPEERGFVCVEREFPNTGMVVLAEAFFWGRLESKKALLARSSALGPRHPWRLQVSIAPGTRMLVPRNRVARPFLRRTLFHPRRKNRASRVSNAAGAEYFSCLDVRSTPRSTCRSCAAPHRRRYRKGRRCRRGRCRRSGRHRPDRG